jgi:DNA-binding response OmpR family regulator
MNILLLEDDPILSAEITNFLSQKGMTVRTVEDGNRFDKEKSAHQPDLMLLDINVPGINGLEICRQVRSNNKKTPIIMLTAYSEINQTRHAFEYGADDYMVKPFHFEELFLRIQSIQRRLGDHSNEESAAFVIDDLEIFESDRQVKRGGKTIELTPKEYKLLLLLAKANGKTIPKQSIAASVWDTNLDSSFNTVEVYINFLRRKIDKDAVVKLIHTRHGYGYYLKAEKDDPKT